MENVLFEVLKKHIGHDIRISEYGEMDNVSLECFDCNEVIIDATLYDLMPVAQDDNSVTELDKAELFDMIVDNMCEIDGISETISYLRRLGLSNTQLRNMKFEV